MSTRHGPGRLVVCSPLRLEAQAVRRGLGDAAEVRRTGYGTARAAGQADCLRHDTFGMLAVGGTGGGIAADLKPGDLVVGTEVTGDATSTSIACPSAPLLAGELQPLLRERYVRIILDGMRPREASVLPGRPLDFAQLRRAKQRQAK